MSPIVTKLPLVPDDLAKPGYSLPYHSVKSLMRAAVVLAQSCGRQDTRLCKKLFPGDTLAEKLVTRSAAPPATTDSWGGMFSPDIVGEFIESLANISASASLFSAAPYVSLDGYGRVLFPRRATAPNPNPAWVDEAAPAPVRSYPLGQAVLGPTCKLMVIAHCTREAAELSGAQTVIETVLREATALDLDASVFSNVAADSSRPAGILQGVAALTPATAGTDAMQKDLTALAKAIAPNASGLAFVMHPAQAQTVRLAKGNTWDTTIPIWSTIGVASGTVIALDPQAFVSGFEPLPELSVNKEGILHESDTPLPIAVPGTPPTVAAPVRSLWQTDAVAIKLMLRCAWTWRVVGCVSWMQNVTW